MLISKFWDFLLKFILSLDKSVNMYYTINIENENKAECVVTLAIKNNHSALTG